MCVGGCWSVIYSPLKRCVSRSLWCERFAPMWLRLDGLRLQLWGLRHSALTLNGSDIVRTSTLGTYTQWFGHCEDFVTRHLHSMVRLEGRLIYKSCSVLYPTVNPSPTAVLQAVLHPRLLCYRLCYRLCYMLGYRLVHCSDDTWNSRGSLKKSVTPLSLWMYIVIITIIYSKILCFIRNWYIHIIYISHLYNSNSHCFLEDSKY